MFPRFGAAMLALLLLGAAACTEPRQPPPTPPPLDPTDRILVLSYNVRGVIRDKDNKPIDPDRLRFVDVLAERIVDRKPHIVLLQEICASQAIRLAERIESRHRMSLVLAPDTERSECPTAVKETGKAMLVVGWWTRMPAPPALATGAPQGCVRWYRPPVVDVCVLHLSPAEAKRVPGAFRNWPHPLILGGDFNSEPSDMMPLYSQRVDRRARGYMFEADMCWADRQCRVLQPGGEATFGQSNLFASKIDYIFMDEAHFLPRANGEVEDTRGKCQRKDCSDHRMLWGELHLAPPSGPPRTMPPGLEFLVGEWGGRGRQLTVRRDGTATFSIRGFPCSDPSVVAGEACEKPGEVGGAATLLELELDHTGGRITGRVISSNNPRVPVATVIEFRRLPHPGTIEFVIPSDPWVDGATNLCNEAISPGNISCG